MLETRKTIYKNRKHLKPFFLYTHSLVPGNSEEKTRYIYFFPPKLFGAHTEPRI